MRQLPTMASLSPLESNHLCLFDDPAFREKPTSATTYTTNNVISIDANFIVFPKVLILGAAIVMQGTQVKNCFYYSIVFCHTSITSFKTR